MAVLISEMASRVNIVAVNILDNPAPFGEPFKLEIVFEVFEHLPEDLDWELVYVGSANSRDYDQVLETVAIGPTPEGRHKFVYTADAPDVNKIPKADLLGATVLLLRCKYNAQEFMNLGWFVSTEYTDEELKENPPAKPDISKLQRTVQTDDLRVTSFPIKWTETDCLPAPPPQVIDEDEEVIPVASDGEDEIEPVEDGDEEGDGDEEEGGDDAAEEDLDESKEDGEENDEEGMDVEEAGPEKTTDAPKDALADVTNA